MQARRETESVLVNTKQHCKRNKIKFIYILSYKHFFKDEIMIKIMSKSKNFTTVILNVDVFYRSEESPNS